MHHHDHDILCEVTIVIHKLPRQIVFIQAWMRDKLLIVPNFVHADFTAVIEDDQGNQRYWVVDSDYIMIACL